MAPGVQQHRRYPPHEPRDGGGEQDDEPEPEEGVDLLVDDVEGHHAHCVVRLYRARRSVLVERALGHLERGVSLR